MTGTVTYALPINPEPWVVGSAFVKRGGGKTFAAIAPDKTLKLYQNAIQAELEALQVEVLPGKYALDLFFFRQNAQYTDAAGRTRTRNTPDVTNLQKATEDALQGVLIDNDRNVLKTSSAMVGAGTDVSPMVVIRLTYGLEEVMLPKDLHDDMNIAIGELRARGDKKIKDSHEANVWTP